MTTSAPIEPDRLFERMVLQAGSAALLAGLACVGVALFAGAAAVAGAAAGLAVVAVFYAVDLWIVRVSRGWDPEATRAAVLGEYVVKVVVLAAAVWWLHDQSWIDPQALAVTVVVVTVVWIVALTVSALRSRSYIFGPTAADPAASPSDPFSDPPRDLPRGLPRDPPSDQEGPESGAPQG
jgi:hypothetical protein